jgi:thymidine kinase
MARELGRIELICGPMFAGKTCELIERLGASRAAGERVAAVQPAGDTRSGRGQLRTHAGEVWPAAAIGAAQDLAAAVGDSSVVGVDEAHFFAEDLADACRSLVSRGVRVIVAGVDFDHRGRLFPAMAALLAIADDRTELTSVCGRCGAVARYTQRLVKSDAAIVVGGAESYEPRCERCFEPGIHSNDGV